MENTIVKENEPKEDLDEKYEEYFEQGRIKFITFHPAYSYEEFIDGITVETGKEGKPAKELQYKLKPGIFKNMCKEALGAAIYPTSEVISEKSWGEVYEDYCEDKDNIGFEEAPKYVLIIDEINRGDMAKIFGELITLLEADKRLGAENELIVTLPTSGDKFGVPPNIYIIATMNTADRSIALIDVALRRRFGFIEMNPDFEVLQDEHIDKNKDKFEKNVRELLNKSKDAILKINARICSEVSIGRDKQIGHSFLFKVYTKNDLLLVWRYEILPLLEEYCYGDYTKINSILFKKEDTKWINVAEGIKDLNINNLDEMITNITKSE